MLRQRARMISGLLWVADMATTVLAFLVSYWIRSEYLTHWDLRPLVPLDYYGWIMIAILITWSLLLYQYGAYRSYRTVSVLNELLTVTKAIIVGTVLVGTITFVFKFEFVSRTLIALFVVVNFLMLAVERLLVRALSWFVRRRGYNFRNVVIVGTGPVAGELCRIIGNYRQWGLRVVGVVTEESLYKGLELEGCQIIGDIRELETLIHNYVVDEVIFAVPGRKLDEIEDTLLMLEEHGINVRLAANIFPHVIAKVQLEELETIPLLTFTTIPTDPLRLAVKRLFDIVVSLMLIIGAAPVMLAAAIAIWATSKGEVLFRQKRCGLNGRIFTLYKFRSMYKGAEKRLKDLETLNEMEGPVFKIKDDPRITPVGKFIRKASIDELPQLWNVLKGDMSIVGPRPPIPEEVGKYERWQRRRLSMRPGITCLWQISGRNKIRDFKEWVKLDLQYIDTWSLSLDLKIFLKTVPVVLFQKGAE